MTARTDPCSTGRGLKSIVNPSPDNSRTQTDNAAFCPRHLRDSRSGHPDHRRRRLLPKGKNDDDPLTSAVVPGALAACADSAAPTRRTHASAYSLRSANTRASASRWARPEQASCQMASWPLIRRNLARAVGRTRGRAVRSTIDCSGGMSAATRLAACVAPAVVNPFVRSTSGTRGRIVAPTQNLAIWRSPPTRLRPHRESPSPASAARGGSTASARRRPNAAHGDARAAADLVSGVQRE
jgi:hypothetical protein